jgi:hypothetical protein
MDSVRDEVEFLAMAVHVNDPFLSIAQREARPVSILTICSLCTCTRAPAPPLPCLHFCST